MPLYFLPEWAEESVCGDSLLELAVAGKLEYARLLWLDELIDKPGISLSLSSVHRLSEALVGLIRSKYAMALGGTAEAAFFATLAHLHARCAAALGLDGVLLRDLKSLVRLEDYMRHAMARHGPQRAPLDAVLLLVGASEEEIARARTSWERWGLGQQFYDDTLDIEEDFEDRRLTWAVARTLALWRVRDASLGPEDLPEPNLFYEISLTGGILAENLALAESFFEESVRLAEPAFPDWANQQQPVLRRTRDLRKDYEELATGAQREQS